MTATASASARARLDRLDAFDLALRLSALCVVITAHHDPLLMVATAVWCVLVLARPGSLHRPLPWFLVTALVAVWQLPDWYAYDNHVWLTTYWTLAVGLCLSTDDPKGGLRLDGRLFVGLIFGIATLWKLLSPDFHSGEFFEYSLLQDGRFASVAEWVGGVPDGALEANDRAVAELATAPPGERATLQSGDRVGTVAWVFTAWGITIEGLIGLTWLAPLPERWRWLRHGCLLAFAGTTYLIVPVGGFGCLLMALGFTQAVAEPRWRLPYLVGFAALLVYGPVWRVTLGA